MRELFIVGNTMQREETRQGNASRCVSQTRQDGRKIKYIFSVINYTIYEAVCFQFTYFPCDDWKKYKLCLISIIISEVWLFRLRLWNNSMRCKSFYIRMEDKYKIKLHVHWQRSARLRIWFIVVLVWIICRNYPYNAVCGNSFSSVSHHLVHHHAPQINFVKWLFITLQYLI